MMGNFLAYELLPIILNMTLTASVVILFVLLYRLLMRKAPRIFSYVLWLVVLFRLLCPVSLTADFSLMGLLDTPVTEVTTHTSAAAYVPRDMVHDPAPAVDLPVPGIGEVVTDALPQGEEQTVADPLEAPMAIATMVWMTGAAAMAVWGVVSLVRLRRRLVGAVPLEKGVYLADHIDTPFVLGLIRPKIYLPSALPEEERGYILLHERCHIRRLDHVVKLLAFLALCIHWFNPLAWLFFVLLGKDMEMSCDEAVIKRLGTDIRADYSASLLRLATGRRILAGTPLAFGEGNTRDRVKNVLRWKEPKLWLVILSAGAVLVLAVVCGTNASSKSTVKTRAAGNGVEVTMTLKAPVRSYAIYQEIYQDGRLISGKPILLGGFQGDWDEMPHRSTFTLRAESSGLPSGGFSGEVTTRFEESGATTERTDQLPRTRYTGMGIVLGTGNHGGTLSEETHRLRAGGSTVLCTLVFSTEADGSIYVYYNGWSLAKYNDTVIQYRLVTSSETAEIYQDMPLDLAQTLYDLRVETLRDPEDYGAQTSLRALLDAMGASACGDYELQYCDLSEEPQFLTALHTGAYWPGGTHSFPPYAKTGLVIWYEEVSDETAFRAMQNAVPDLLLALAPELSEVQIGCTGPDGTAGYAGSSDENTAYVRELLGYESFEEAGGSAAGIRALMEVLEWPESPSKPRLTLEDVQELSERKGEALSWADFEDYEYIETGSGLYIRDYPIDGTFSLGIGGGWLDEEPLYMYLNCGEDFIDIRREDVDAFIRRGRAVQRGAELLSDEETAGFNERFQSLVWDKQGNMIGVNAVSCFFTSYYEDVTELDFKEFLRYFPGDGSQTSEAEFQALKSVEGWPFAEVETLADNPVPVHRYPRRLVDLALEEYAGITTEDLDTSAVAYLPEYDAYYNYTSDFGPGMFTCTWGEREGNVIRLYQETGDRTIELTLREMDEGAWRFVSFLPLDPAA